jgi:methyltransferase family protein
MRSSSLAREHTMTNPTAKQPRALSDLPAFSPQPWQMSYGERTAIEGVLAMVKPRLAIEIGRAEGGSLRRIAEHSDRVVSLDIVDAPAELAELTNVRTLSGDSHALLPEELKRMSEEGQNVDFVLVDGDHSTEGVRRDMQDLVDSPALASTVILAHDTLNEEVRQGLQEVDYDAHEKVAWVDLDFIPGYVARLPQRLGECWGGLGLVVVDASGAFRPAAQRRNRDLFEQPKLVWPAAQWIRREGAGAAERLDEVTLVADSALTEAQRENAILAAELERHRGWLRGIHSSASWRLTSPLRALKSGLLERLR